jgi:hypothetical protein
VCRGLLFLVVLLWGAVSRGLRVLLCGAGVGFSGAGFESFCAFVFVACDEFGDPSFGDVVVAGDVGLGASFEDDGGDDQAGF